MITPSKGKLFSKKVNVKKICRQSFLKLLDIICFFDTLNRDDRSGEEAGKDIDKSPDHK